MVNERLRSALLSQWRSSDPAPQASPNGDGDGFQIPNSIVPIVEKFEANAPQKPHKSFKRAGLGLARTRWK
jgi:hypothetical protein